VEVAVMPILLGHGIPLVAGGFSRSRLTLTRSEVRSGGIMRLHYDVQHVGGRANT
jgi:hypothetical protein